jgi:hypothetical protein
MLYREHAGLPVFRAETMYLCACVVNSVHIFKRKKLVSNERQKRKIVFLSNWELRIGWLVFIHSNKFTIYTYIYIFICIYIHIFIYMYIYIYI